MTKKGKGGLRRWGIIIGAILTVFLVPCLVLSMTAPAVAADGSVTVTVQVNTSTGTGLSGVTIQYYDGYWKAFGTTDGSGAVSKDLPSGTWQFNAAYKGTSAQQSEDIGTTPTVTFYTSEAVVEVKASDSTVLSGVATYYYAGYDRGMGNTDGSGKASAQVFPGTYTFKAAYGGTSATQSGTIPGDGLTPGYTAKVTFYTSEAVVEVKACDGTPLSGVATYYYAGYDRGMGNTDGSGKASAQVFPGTYTFKAAYGGTSATQSGTIPGDGKTSGYSATVTFNPTKVTMQYSGKKYYYAGYWRGFSGTIYMFPGTYTFKFDSYQQDISISGCEVTNSVFIILLEDTNGAGVPGGQAYLGVSGWPNIGDTDANGVLIYIHNDLVEDMEIKMEAPIGVPQTINQHHPTESIYTFQIDESQPMTVDAGGPYYIGEGGSVEVSATGSDPNDSDGSTLTYAWDLDNDGTFEELGQTVTFSAALLDGPGERTIQVRVNNGTSSATDEATVNIFNLPPTIIEPIDAPADPVKVNTVIDFSADFTDPGIPDTHTAKWDWGDSNDLSDGVVTESDGSGTVKGEHVYTCPGIYTITLIVYDDDEGEDQCTYRYVVVYNPDGGFVTGGGWIDSPEGAYTEDPALTGKATFGFISKYQKGASIPKGQTEFQFKAGNLNFHSSEYQWLVVAGFHAKFKGSGTINGKGNYGFMLTVTDGQINGGGGFDLFRIKIWNKENGDGVVYDNKKGGSDDSYDGTEIGGGSIVIHK